MRGLVTTITFATFMTEAILHYSLGRAEAKGTFELKLPPRKELLKIAAITGVFAVANGLIVDGVTKALTGKGKGASA
jgi:hypothetical protein